MSDNPLGEAITREEMAGKIHQYLIDKGWIR